MNLKIPLLSVSVLNQPDREGKTGYEKSAALYPVQGQGTGYSCTWYI